MSPGIIFISAPEGALTEKANQDRFQQLRTASLELFTDVKEVRADISEVKEGLKM